MKTIIISIVVIVAILCGCSSSISSISSEDLRQMKEQSEYLLTIDSTMCTPDLIRRNTMNSCYRMVRLNQEYKNYRFVFDKVAVESYMPNPPYNYNNISDKDKYDTSKVIITRYKVRYYICKEDEWTREVLSFSFQRDPVTQRLYCDDVVVRRSIPLEYMLEHLHIDNEP
jgi:hypothetical protein